MEARRVLEAALERAIHMEPGPGKEREINRVVIALVRLLVRDAEPRAREVWLDWGQPGLSIFAILDEFGDWVSDPYDVDDDLEVYVSNIRDTQESPEFVAPRGINGPFILQV